MKNEENLKYLKIYKKKLLEYEGKVLGMEGEILNKLGYYNKKKNTSRRT